MGKDQFVVGRGHLNPVGTVAAFWFVRIAVSRAAQSLPLQSRSLVLDQILAMFHAGARFRETVEVVTTADLERSRTISSFAVADRIPAKVEVEFRNRGDRKSGSPAVEQIADWRPVMPSWSWRKDYLTTCPELDLGVFKAIRLAGHCLTVLPEADRADLSSMAWTKRLSNPSYSYAGTGLTMKLWDWPRGSGKRVRARYAVQPLDPEDPNSTERMVKVAYLLEEGQISRVVGLLQIHFARLRIFDGRPSRVTIRGDRPPRKVE